MYNKWWTNTNSCCEQTWFVCGVWWLVGLFLKMQNLQQLFRNRMVKLKIHPNHWICPICCIVLVLWLKVQMLWLNVDSFHDIKVLVFLWRLVSILHRSLRLQFWCKFAPVQPQKKWFGLLMRGERRLGGGWGGRQRVKMKEMRGCRDFLASRRFYRESRRGCRVGEILVSMGQSEAACIIYSV